jgi:hypothetical protein
VDSDGILAHVRHGRLDVADLEAAILEYLS